MTYEMLSLKKEEEGVAILTLKNPPVNALSTKLIDELGKAVAELSHDPAHRVLIITGDGQFFSAGADLKEIASKADEFLKSAGDIVRHGQEAYRAIEKMPQPVIAAINGLAVGGGLEMTLACDIRVAGDSAKVGLPEVQYGLMPAYGGTQRLARTVGLAKAREMIYTGALINAQEALRIGLVNKVVPSGQELRASRDMAHTIAQKAPLAVAGAKKAMLAGFDQDIDTGLQGEAHAFESVSKSEDLLEGIAAFVERRPPKFAGK